MTYSNMIRRECCPLYGENKSHFLLQKEGATYIRCSHCKLIFTNPAPSSLGLKNVADEWAVKHHAGNHRTKWEGNLNLRDMTYGLRISRIKQYRKLNSLLDVGCSTGEFLEYAKTKGWNVTGCELARHTARIARERVGCEIINTSFEDTGFEDACFDVVTMWDVIEHLFDPAAVLKEIWRVLRPGGILALNTPNYNSLSRFILGNKWEALIPPRHLFVFTPATIKSLVTISGGKIIETKTVDINPMDILTGILRRKSYGFEMRKNNISKMKNIMLAYPFMSRIRKGINTFLNISHLGDILEVYAERLP